MLLILLRHMKAVRKAITVLRAQDFNGRHVVWALMEAVPGSATQLNVAHVPVDFTAV